MGLEYAHALQPSISNLQSFFSWLNEWIVNKAQTRKQQLCLYREMLMLKDIAQTAN